MNTKSFFSRRKSMLLTPILAMLALVFSAGSASAVVGGMTIGGCIFTGEGSATYSMIGGELEADWTTTYAGAAPVTDAQVMIQNMHSGGTHITYGTMGVGGANCWEATIPDTKVAGTPDASEVIAVITAPGHAVTTREFSWDPDGRFDPVNWGVLPSPTAPHWPGGATMGHFTHPTGVHVEAGGTGTESLWVIGPQDAYLMSYPQKTTSALHYIFYDNLTDGNDNGPVIDPGVNGVTVRVFDEHGTVVATQVTGELAFSQGGFITDDGILYAGPAAYGLVYFQGLDGDDEYLIEADPSTVTQADNPHFTLNLPDSAGACTSGGHVNYDQASCKWWQNYTEERGHAGEIYAWPGSPGTMGGGYLTWHAIVEKLPSNINPLGALGNPALNGTINGILLDSTGADPAEATGAVHGGRVPPTNARFENNIAWNRTRSAGGWGGVPNPGEPASDVIPNSRVMDGRVILYKIDGDLPRVIGTAVATNPADVNDPGTGGLFEFTNVPPGTYGLYGMDRDLNYVSFIGTTVTVTPTAIASVSILYERFGARSMGFIQRNGGPAAGLTVKNWYKAGTTKGIEQSNANGWFVHDFWPETGQMGFQFVDMTDGVDFRGKIITEQFQDVPMQLGFDTGPITYNWATHNAINRAVGYATHNYFVDLQIEDIPTGVGNLIGAVFNDHFSSKLDPAKHNRGNGVYDEDEDRLWQGWGVELYNAPAPFIPVVAPIPPVVAPTPAEICATLATTIPAPLPVGTRTTGKFTKSDNAILGWNAPYSYPADEVGSMTASPVSIFPGGGPVSALPPADYAASAYPNIGTSASEAALFATSATYAPLPGYYEFRDLTPGDYCVRSMPKNGYRRSPDADVEPGGFRPVVISGTHPVTGLGVNSRVDLGVNTTPTSTAVLGCPTCITPVVGDAFCTGYVAPVGLAQEVLGTCDSNPAYSCVEDAVVIGQSADCVGIAHPFGLKMAGEIEGGMWDGMQATDTNPTSLLWMDAIALFGSPIAVKDGNDYLLGVGYQGDPRCHAWNNTLHTPGASMLPIGSPGYDSFACRSTIVTKQKPEFERRFAPGANRYIGNAYGYLWNRMDPSIPAGWYGQDEHNSPAYDSMELGIGVPQAGYKFEAAWTPLVATTGGGVTADICAIGLSAVSFASEPWGAVATVTVSDGFTMISGAEVVGTWSNGKGQTCVTGITGQCVIVLEKVDGGGPSITFTVDNVIPDVNQPWYVYNVNTGGILNGACRTTVTAYDPITIPPPPPPTPQCSDGIDNDGDGLIDMLDPGCVNAQDDNEQDAPLVACNDGVDNDADGLIDFPADPGCTSATDTNETNAACNDGLDNDGDLLIDFPADPGCTSLADNDEFNAILAQCMNGIDDDFDGLIDMLDPGCSSITDNDETDPPVGGPVNMHLAGFSGAPVYGGEKFKATITVTTHDNTDTLIGNVTANISYTWLKEGQPTTKQMSCVTNASGTCSVTTKGLEGVGSADFSISTLSHASLPYERPDNEAGTAITVSY